MIRRWIQKHSGHWMWKCERMQCDEPATELVYVKEEARYHYACKEHS